MNATKNMKEYQVFRFLDAQSLALYRQELIPMIVKFVKKSETKSFTVEYIYTDITETLTRRDPSFGMWIVTEKESDKLVGYAIARLFGVDGIRRCFILQAYSTLSEVGTAGFNAIKSWANQNKCHSINFLTSRDDIPYQRLLKKYGFTKKSVEFEVELNGRIITAVPAGSTGGSSTDSQ